MKLLIYMDCDNHGLFKLNIDTFLCGLLIVFAYKKTSALSGLY